MSAHVTTTSSAAIETHALARRYGRTDALHDLTLTVPTGAIYALLGPNGAGKTTTIKLLMGLLTPTAGHARVLGTDSRRLGARERAQIGYVSENQQLPLWMTVRQFLDYCRPFYPTWDAALEKTLLAKLALPPERKLKHLSRGMLMKTALLSSLAYRPKLLVLDEPFSGLDPLVRDEFIQGVLETSSAGDWTVFISSHDISEIEQLADHVGILQAGRLQLSEPTESLQSRFRRVEVTLPSSFTLPSSPFALPSTWLGYERTGSLARFIDTRFDAASTEAACRTHFPDAAITAHPMTLREIFVALARDSQTAAAKGTHS
jgi:ABC-2 type transport system ATP-binding protein